MEYFDSYTTPSHLGYVTRVKYVWILVEIILLLDNRFNCSNIEAFEVFIMYFTRLILLTEERYTNVYFSWERY
jgi:hypothetical protein